MRLRTRIHQFPKGSADDELSVLRVARTLWGRTEWYANEYILFAYRLRQI